MNAETDVFIEKIEALSPQELAENFRDLMAEALEIENLEAQAAQEPEAA